MQKKNVYETYETIVDWFDIHRSRELFEKPYLDLVIEQLPKGGRVLDLGCGMGEPIAAYFVNQGFEVTGVDASAKMLSLAEMRVPQAHFILEDMRNINLDKKYDCILAWHSFFHLPHEDQRTMFDVFEQHIAANGFLIFTAGPEESEVWSDNGGEQLYHASLSLDEYQTLLTEHHFNVILNKVRDPQCREATFWIAQYQ